jgi:hypothetical protein
MPQELTTQVLDPDPTDAAVVGQVLGVRGDIEFEEEGSVALDAGQLEVDVSFLYEKASDDYRFIENYIESPTAAVEDIRCVVRKDDRKTTGFKVALSAAPDTSGSIYRWHIKVRDRLQVTQPPSSQPRYILLNGVRDDYVVLAADYGAIGDGIVNDGQAIQDAINALGFGGIVRLENRNYFIGTFLITLPDGVSLVGTAANGISSTISREDILTRITISGRSSASPSAQAWITLGYNSVLSNVRVVDADQDRESDTPVAKPYAVRCTWASSAVVNVELYNTYFGIDAAVGRVLLRDIYGYPLKCGIKVVNAADVVRLQSCNFVPTWALGYALQDWVQANGSAFRIESADDWKMSDCFAIYYKYGIEFTGGTSYGVAVNSSFDGCTTSAFFDTGSHITFPGITFVGCGFNGSIGLDIRCSGAGPVQLIGSRLWSGSPILHPGTVPLIANGNWFTPGGANPSIVVSGAPDISIIGNRFAGAGPHISVTNAAATGIIEANSRNCQVSSSAPGLTVRTSDSFDVNNITPLTGFPRVMRWEGGEEGMQWRQRYDWKFGPGDNANNSEFYVEFSKANDDYASKIKALSGRFIDGTSYFRWDFSAIRFLPIAAPATPSTGAVLYCNSGDNALHVKTADGNDHALAVV